MTRRPCAVPRRPRTSPRAPGLVLVLAVGLAGCSTGSDEPDAAPSPATSSSASGTPEPGAPLAPPPGSPTRASGARSCELLGTAEVAELAGRDLGAGRPVATDSTGGLPVCEWGEMSHRGVQVSAVPARVWAGGLPEAVAALGGSALAEDPESARRLRAAADLVAGGDDLSAARSCRLFGTLVRVSGAAAGQDRSLSVVPSTADPQAVIGQTCRAGRYVSVLLVRPDLTGASAEPLARRVEAVRERLLSRTAR